MCAALISTVVVVLPLGGGRDDDPNPKTIGLRCVKCVGFVDSGRRLECVVCFITAVVAVWRGVGVGKKGRGDQWLCI